MAVEMRPLGTAVELEENAYRKSFSILLTCLNSPLMSLLSKLHLLEYKARMEEYLQMFELRRSQSTLFPLPLRPFDEYGSEDTYRVDPLLAILEVQTRLLFITHSVAVFTSRGRLGRMSHILTNKIAGIIV